MRRFLSLVSSLGVIALLGLITAVGVAAQSSTGSMRGTVKDAQGVIPGATVALVNDENGTSRETVSNEAGEIVQESYTTLAGRSEENGESGFNDGAA